MRHAFRLSLLALFVLATGCSSALSPLQQASVAADTLTATQTGIEAAGRAGLLTPQQVLDTEPIDFAARQFVSDMFVAAEAGSPDAWPSAFWTASRAFAVELSKLKSVQQSASRQIRRPATLPHR